MKGFIEVTEVSGGNTRAITIRVDHVTRYCECGTIYTLDGNKFIANQSYQEIKELIKQAV